MKNEVGLAGLFRFVVRRPDGTVRKDTGWFKNLILDAGLNRLGSTTTANADAFCRVGTGATAPSVGQTALVNQVASTNTVQNSVQGYDSIDNLYGYYRQTYRFAAGVAAGVLAEVGIGWSSTGATLFSRALILDDQGNPTTITVLADEVLDVSYEFRIYRPVNDFNFNVNISGVTYACTRRAANMSSWGAAARYALLTGFNVVNQLWANGSVQIGAYGPGALGPVTGNPSGPYRGGHSNNVSAAAYVNNSYEAYFTATFNLTSVTASIGSITIATVAGIYQTSFTPEIPKDNTKTLSLTWKHSWARKVL